jgi:hypothetical protein
MPPSQPMLRSRTQRDPGEPGSPQPGSSLCKPLEIGGAFHFLSGPVRPLSAGIVICGRDPSKRYDWNLSGSARVEIMYSANQFGFETAPVIADAVGNTSPRRLTLTGGFQWNYY